MKQKIIGICAMEQKLGTQTNLTNGEREKKIHFPLHCYVKWKNR